MFNGKIHYKWSFSIAMLNYHRVTCLFPSLMNMMISTGLTKRGLQLMPPFVSISFSRSQLFFFCVKEGPSGVGNKRFHQWFHKSIMEPGGREDFSNRNILAMYFSNRNIETWLDYMENLPVRYTVVI